MEIVRRVSGRCPEGVLRVSGRCLKGVWSRVVKTMVPWYPWYLGRFQNCRKIEKIC